MSDRPLRRLPPDGLRPDEVEAAIADLPFERAYLFDGSGQQVGRFEGDESHVVIRLSPSERERMRGGMMFHNHPPDLDLPARDPRYDAASLSDLDILWAAEHDLAAIVAVSPRWRHRFNRPSDGWYARLPTEAEFEDSLKLLYDDIGDEDRRSIAGGELTSEGAAATRAHRANERFSREIGAVYRRERR